MTRNEPFDETTRGLLQTYDFDRPRFEAHRAALAAQRLGPEANRIGARIEPPHAGDITHLPEPGSAERARLEQEGERAIRRGEVGMVILAGGMATRFGGVVKAAVPVLGEATFLDLKLLDLERLSARLEATIPLLVMTSFATDATLRELLEGRGDERVPIERFAQEISLRLCEDGEIFLDARGRPSPYAPGHGDLSFALRRSGALGRFRARGGRLLFMCNVDNLTATLDPAILGAHLAQGGAITAEVVSKLPGDRGGAPARIEGRAQIVESFRFPETFEQDSIGVFNTNTFVLDAEAIDRDFELTFFAVRKEVQGRTAVQLERLVGELTARLPSRFLQVPREGPGARFQPAKDPAELARRVPEIEDALRARGILPPA